MALEQLTDPELSYLGVELSQEYALIIKKQKQDIMCIIAGLYEIDEETYKHCRKLLEDWMYAIADILEYK